MLAEEYPKVINQAYTLKQNGNWQGALELYESAYADESKQSDQNLVLSLLSCLKKLERYDRAIEIGLTACEREGHWEAVANLTAWCVYYRYFRQETHLPAEQAVEWLETIKSISPLKQGLHPLPLSVFSFLAKSPDLLPALVVQICGLLDPDLLETTPQPSNKPGVLYPSHREKYASLLSKALFNLGDYASCLDLCRKTLSLNLKLSTNADVWFKRRSALCLAKLGDYRTALDLYEEILKRKRDWFILYEAALAAYRLELYDRSLALALQAANAYGEPDTKIHLWELLQNLMARNKKFDRSIEMLRLCAAIRKQRQWSLDRNLLLDLQAHNIDPDKLPPYKEILANCRSWLAPRQSEGQKELSGIVTKLLPHGKAGFLKSGADSYYFLVPQCQFPAEDVQPGLKVRFRTQPSFDQKKQQATLMAVRIRKIKD